MAKEVSLSSIASISAVPQPWRPAKEDWMVMITMGMSSFLVALDAGILVTVLPSLAKALNGTALEAFWTGTSYLVSNAVVQPPVAALSDILGRRELLLPSLIIFTGGSIVCGVARNFTVLLAGRVVQGIGGGGIITLAQLVFADIVPLRQRPRFFAIVLGAWALGIMLGPVLGGLFTERVSWRWCFFINLPFCGCALPMAAFFVKLDPPEREPLHQRLRRMDWIGCSLFTCGLVVFLVAITNAGVAHPWISWRTMLPLCAGMGCIALTIIYECWWAQTPFLHRALFPHLSAVATYFAALFQGFLLYMTLYYITSYLAATHLTGPVGAGVKSLPALVVCMVSSPLTSALITRYGKYRWAIWAGYAIGALGCGLLALLDPDSTLAVYSSIPAVVGLGLGMVLAAVNFAIQASVREVDSGRAAAMYAFMRSVGMCMGVSIGLTIFLNVLKGKLLELDLSAAIGIDAAGYVEKELMSMKEDDPMRTRVLQAYGTGFRGVFIGMAAISAAALVISLAIKHCSIDRPLERRFTIKRGTTSCSKEISVA